MSSMLGIKIPHQIYKYNNLLLQKVAVVKRLINAAIKSVKDFNLTVCGLNLAFIKNLVN